MKNFIAIFLVCFFLIVTVLVLFGDYLLSGWSLILFLAFLLALCISGYLHISERLERIEQQLGIAPEDVPTLTERWKTEREAEESEHS